MFQISQKAFTAAFLKQNDSNHISITIPVLTIEPVPVRTVEWSGSQSLDVKMLRSSSQGLGADQLSFHIKTEMLDFRHQTCQRLLLHNVKNI